MKGDKDDGYHVRFSLVRRVYTHYYPSNNTLLLIEPPRSFVVRFQPEPGFFPNSDGIGQYMWPRFLSAIIKIDYRRLDWCSLPLICSSCKNPLTTYMKKEPYYIGISRYWLWPLHIGITHLAVNNGRVELSGVYVVLSSSM